MVNENSWLVCNTLYVADDGSPLSERKKNKHHIVYLGRFIRAEFVEGNQRNV